jgi:hypothetical protein
MRRRLAEMTTTAAAAAAATTTLFNDEAGILDYIASNSNMTGK